MQNAVKKEPGPAAFAAGPGFLLLIRFPPSYPVSSCSVQSHGNAQSAQMIFQSEFMPMFSEPCLLNLIVRHDRSHHVPEIPGMIHLSEMTQFMHHHIIQNHRRGENETIVEGQCAPGGTAAPTTFLISYGNGSIVSAGDRMIMCDAALNLYSGGISIPFFQCRQPSAFGVSQRCQFLLCHGCISLLYKCVCPLSVTMQAICLYAICLSISITAK